MYSPAALSYRGAWQWSRRFVVCSFQKRCQKCLVFLNVALGETDAIPSPARVVVHQVQAFVVELRSRFVRAFQPHLHAQPVLLRTEDDEVARLPVLCKTDIEFVV